MGRITPTTGDYSRTCDCKTGYERDNQKVCKPVNLCDKNTDGKPNNKCGATNDCAYTGPGAYKCTCKSGYSGTETANDKATCAEINACDTNNGGCGKRNGGAGAISSTCTKTGPDTRTCACKTGYTSSFGGEKCVEIDMCSDSKTHNCKNSNGAQQADHCSKTGPGIFKCTCPAAFKQDAAKTGCVAVEKCGTSNGGCHVQATCATNSQTAKVTCECNTGYSGNGASCSAPVPKLVAVDSVKDMKWNGYITNSNVAKAEAECIKRGALGVFESSGNPNGGQFHFLYPGTYSYPSTHPGLRSGPYVLRATAPTGNGDCTYTVGISKSDVGSNEAMSVKFQDEKGETFSFDGCSPTNFDGSASTCIAYYGIKAGGRKLVNSKGKHVGDGNCCNGVQNKVVRTVAKCSASGGVAKWTKTIDKKLCNTKNACGVGTCTVDECGPLCDKDPNCVAIAMNPPYNNMCRTCTASQLANPSSQGQWSIWQKK